MPGTRTWVVTAWAKDADGVYCYLAPGAMPERMIALWNHDEDRVLGTWENFRELGDAVLADFKPLPGLAELEPMVAAALEANVPLGASIGFVEYTAHSNERWEVRRITEISLVSSPCNPACLEYKPKMG